ncbi:MAG TPA: Vms1/Ankzf1 family peptidyl-tRNA hydrolase [Jatrophihabitans sp.]|nr:Vms1/Ankzf1 family peptidyl-tRNA hydrolase [Jatrophihabitans sp.]
MNVLDTPQRLADVYARRGPFATVYLDATRATESGAQEIARRWAAVRDELERAGADTATLDAVAGAVEADTGTPGRHGIVVVAAGGDVCLRDVLPQPPSRSSGSWSPVPRLLPYLGQRTTEIAHLVVVADRGGADLLSVGPGGAREQTVAGERDYPMHRTAADVWNERHFQHRVENTWESNAQNVADAVAKLIAESPARLVVVAGDVRARNLIAEALGSPPGVTVRVIEEGGRAAGSSTEALQAAVHDAVLQQVWRDRREVLEHLQQNLGRQEYAVAGVAPVVEALRMSQVDTLVISDDPSSPLTAWVGPEPLQFGLDDGEAEAMGVAEIEHDRLDAALVRAAVGTNARLVITPGGHEYLAEGIGALLRYQTAGD